MSAGSSKGFFLSTLLHAVVAALILYFTLVFNRTEPPPQVFELVAGEGDNYLAQEAPALGTPGGVSIDLPKMPEPRPAPPEPVPAPIAEPSPIVPAPPSPPPPKATPKPESKPEPKAPDPSKDMSKSVRWAIIRAESQAKLDLKRQRAAEAKKAAEEKRRREEEARRMTKEEFDRLNASKKSTPAKTAPAKIAKIDAEGISKGVIGGSTANKSGGAGGKSLTASNARAVELYFEMLKQKVRAQLVGLAGMDDRLAVTVLVHISASGVLSRARVKSSSGNPEFDRAVIAAFDGVRMPEHPEKKSEELELIFRTRDIEQL